MNFTEDGIALAEIAAADADSSATKHDHVDHVPTEHAEEQGPRLEDR
jgi:hypothetical protein